GYKMLVTGGDCGIGGGGGIGYGKEGGDVGINYVGSEEKEGEEVKEVIEEGGEKGVVIGGDIGDEQFKYEMVEEGDQELGGVDNVRLVGGDEE
ncbi:SDR family NAD(P)-dependent oxidoreductase, partial [Staphylococcus warneri]|uniref:SDR family NAD(P)-dependent oxidoreductase n=1 Tax=Staphylococcus warneri TaxID=1292 RepID=UPI00119EEF80